MKIAEINGCAIHVLAKDHTMIICEPDAIFFRCTICCEIKSVHMMAGSSEKDIPWLRLCTCNSNAPHSGGNTQPLEASEPTQEQHEPDLAQWNGPFTDAIVNGLRYRARLVESDHS